MKFSLDTNTEAGQITIQGRFDFNAHRHFKNAYELLLTSENVQEIEIEMSRVHYIDSSALGMLILLRERASRVNKTISLSVQESIVGQVLEVANFSRIFNIK